MARIILVKSNIDADKPKLYVRTAISLNIEVGQLVSADLNEPVPMLRDGKKEAQSTVAIEHCFEFNSVLFEQINSLILVAEQNLQAAQCQASELTALGYGAAGMEDPDEDIPAWAPANMVFH